MLCARRSALLPRLCLLLALCFVWSFAIAPCAVAAETSKSPPSSNAHSARHYATPAERLANTQYEPARYSVPARILPASPASSAVSIRVPILGLTLLNEVGHLARTVTVAQVLAWERELVAGRVPAERSALLHLWLGEWQMAHNAQPGTAAQDFRVTLHLTGSADPLHGLAAYDTSLTLFYRGAYSQATDAFQSLLRPKTVQPGYDLRKCALWLRHAGACAGYHDQRAKQGIPEPPLLDPECGVAALAAGLRALSLPYDRSLLHKSCRVTGQGSSLDDLQTAGAKLGVTVHILGADDNGLMALPKPLIAHVEHDHFVALVRADKTGVSYLCSDCGAWPGGRVDLTWKQWHLLEADCYGAMCLKGGAWDKTLAAVLASPTGTPKSAPSIRVASAGPLIGLGTARGSLLLPRSLASLRRHIVRVDTGGRYAYCDRLYSSLHCPDCITACPVDGGGPGNQAGGPTDPGPSPIHPVQPPGLIPADAGPSAGDPVNLATGEEEYAPPADLTVYNPHGPSVTWRRFYHDLGDWRQETPSAGLGYGWSNSYDYTVTYGGDSSGNFTIHIITPSGAYITASMPAGSAPTAANPRVSVTLPPGTPLLLEWDYQPSAYAPDQFILTFPDRSQWLMQTQECYGSPPDGANFFYTVNRITDRNGNYINFNTTDSGSSLTTTITDSSGQALLTITLAPDPNDPYGITLSSVSDIYGRSVYYHVGLYGLIQGTEEPFFPNLDQVSQVVPSATTHDTALSQYRRFTYGYTIFHGSQGIYDGAALLHTITVPSPTGSGTSTSTINYNDGFLVSSIVDGNGNTRTYDYASIDAAHTTVNVTDAHNAPVYSYSVGYNGDMSGNSRTDGKGNPTSQKIFSDPNNPLRPATVTDGNGNVSRMIWDQYGNLHQTTSPRGIVTNFFYGFPPMTYGDVQDVPNTQPKSDAFALGELLSMQEGAKAPTGYAYYEPSGLLHTLTTPAPGTTGSTSTITTSWAYDGLGNVLTMTTPGNNATVVSGVDQGITTTFGYTQDGGYSQPAAIGQPLTSTDNLGKVTHFRYDGRGNRTAVTDALGNETDTSYNIADQPLTTTDPATGQSGPGHASQTTTYLYVGGPMTTTLAYDEGNTSGPIRQVNHAYGPEGETLGTSGSTEPVTYAYDAQYRLSALTDGGGHTTRYYYKQQGYLDAMTYPGYAGPAPVYNSAADGYTNVSGPDSLRFPSYDANGDLLTRIDGNGVTTAYTHSADPESLLTLTHYAYPQGYAGTQIADVSFSYDGYGRRSGMGDGTGSQSYGYDDLDAPLSHTTAYNGLSADTLTYAYYPDGSRQTMNTPAGAFSYRYDADGRMAGLTNPYNEASSWQYLDNGWLHTQAMGNGVVTAYAYNALGQTTDQQTRTGAGTLLADYGGQSYDGVGDRLGATASLPAGPAAFSGTLSYGYDSRSRLTGEQSSRNGGYAYGFAYDGGAAAGPGNPTTFRGAARAFNADNQDTQNAYDGDGSPVVYRGMAMRYDPEGRLTQVGTAEINTYTGDGLRAVKSFDANYGDKAYYLYDGDEPVIELDNGGGVMAVHTFGADGLLSRGFFGGTTFYTWDPQGCAGVRTDAGASVIAADIFDGFGGRASTDGADTFSGFGGQWGCYTDGQTGLVLMTHRFYDPAAGRFLTRDPMGYDGGVNLYAYCTNDPINECDPLGKHGGGWYYCSSHFVPVVLCFGYCVETCTLVKTVFGKPSPIFTIKYVPIFPEPHPATPADCASAVEFQIN